MQSLSSLLSGARRKKQISLDEKTIFFLFERIVRERYGSRGVWEITPKRYHKKKLFLVVKSSLWAQEVWRERKKMCRLINQKAGEDVLQEICLLEH